jgi:hypothetical protein
MDAALRFDVLRHARGETYRALVATDGFLSGLESVAEARRGSADWEDRVLAGIVLARRRDPEIFEDVGAEFGQIDPSFQSRTIMGLEGVARDMAATAANTWGSRALPVALEGITARVPDDPWWRTNGYLGMIGALPEPLSVEPVAALLVHTADDRVRFGAARALVRLPRDRASQARRALGEQVQGIARALAHFDSEIQP